MEREYHELSYMKASLELVDVKEEIEHLLKEKYALDQKLQRKSKEQNELTEKCMRHITVLKRKGMTSDFYCPKKRGVMVTPTKTSGSSYAPNYIPSPHSYDPNYVPPPHGGTPPQAQFGNVPSQGTPPQAQFGNVPSQGSIWSPLRTGQLAPTTPGCSPSRFSLFHAMGGLLNSQLPTSTPQKSALPQDNKAKKSLIIRKKGAYNDGLTDKEMTDFLKEIDDDKNAVKQDDRNAVTSDTVDSKHDKNTVKQDDRYAVKLDDEMTSETVASKDDKNALKQQNDMTSDTVDSKDKSDSLPREDDRNAAKQDDEHKSDYGPDLVKRQILQGE